MDIRSKKIEPVAQSEDQEDELLSILPIKGCVVILSGTFVTLENNLLNRAGAKKS